MAMMPLWLFTLGSTLFPSTSGQITIPYTNLLTSLLSLTFPLLIGITLAHKFPSFASFSHSIIRPFTAILMVFSLVASLFLYNFIYLLFTWRIAFCGASVAIIGYSLGGIAALAARLPRPQLIAISIETALQNGGIAFILLLLSLQQPDADIASVPCIAQLILTSQPLWLVLAIIKMSSWWRKRKEKSMAISVDYDNQSMGGLQNRNGNVKDVSNGKLKNTSGSALDQLEVRMKQVTIENGSVLGIYRSSSFDTYCYDAPFTVLEDNNVKRI